MNDVHVWKKKNCTMTASLMVDYIKRVLIPNFGSQKKKLLIMDSCSAHRTQAVKDELHANNFDLAIIPGGWTKYLQPLDLTVNRSFKASLKRMRMSMMENALSQTRPTKRERLLCLLIRIHCGVQHGQSTCIKRGFNKLLNENSF